MPSFAFHQVDVFTVEPLRGNPLAVVVGADGLDDARMAAFARWTNLSETTFLLQPTDPGSDYRVRIFTPLGELPFAGHPTLGSGHVWLAEGGEPRGQEVVQECVAGLVRLRRDEGRLAFLAPPLLRSGPVDPRLVDRAASGVGLAPEAVMAAAWVDNGPGWMALLLRSRADVMAARPDYAALAGLEVGLVGPWDPVLDGPECQFELRAFVGSGGYEDPVTGSLNASVAQWLTAEGLAPATYVASQGTALGRAGRVHLRREGSEVWVGGAVAPCIRGHVTL